MIGSLFAGTEELQVSDLFQGRRSKLIAAWDHSAQCGRLSRSLRAGDGGKRIEIVPEGIEGRVAYKERFRNDDAARRGLRSGMGYTGCRSIKEFQENSRFIRITSAGLRESHVHDVIITKEAPNYRLE